MSWINVTWQGGKGPTPPPSAPAKHIMSFSFLCNQVGKDVYAPPMGQYVSTSAQPDVSQMYFPWDMQINHIMIKPLANTADGTTQIILCAPDPLFDLSVDIPKGSLGQQIIEMKQKVAKNVKLQWKIGLPPGGKDPYVVVTGWFQYEIVEPAV